MDLNFIQTLILSSLFFVGSTLTLSSPFLGISPDDIGYYKSGSNSNSIKCKDGSKHIDLTHLNDDFCDCLDGSDEPGTSACPNGSFYCHNAGNVPLVLFSSRVNDGICDCCDGSDEYDGQITCPNTCWEAGKVARDKLKKKIATYEEGVIMRKKKIEKAKLGFAKDQAELSKLKGEEKALKNLVQKLQDRKEQIEKQEEKERLEKEKEEKLRREAENEEKERLEKEKEEKLGREAETESDQDRSADDKEAESVLGENSGTTNDDDVIGNAKDQGPGEVISEVVNSDLSEVEESHSNEVLPPAERNDGGLTDASLSDHENKDITASEGTKGLSKEELGRLVASRWTGEKPDHRNDDTDDIKDIDDRKETPRDVHEEDYDGYASEYSDDDHKYDDSDSVDHKYDDSHAADHSADDLTAGDHVDSSSYKSDSEDESEESGITASSNPSWFEKMQKTLKNILQGFRFSRTPLNLTDAARIRKEYDESSGKLSKLQSRISTLSEKLTLDFGPEKEFYSFYDRCFESKENKYIYKICPYEKATQEEGHSTTRLGHWEKFEDSYKVMLFSDGDRCWSGPDRSMRVKLKCGLKNEVTDVDEPSRCEYVALLSTPSACVEDKLQELKQKLDALNKQQPPNHDEF